MYCTSANLLTYPPTDWLYSFSTCLFKYLLVLDPLYVLNHAWYHPMKVCAAQLLEFLKPCPGWKILWQTRFYPNSWWKSVNGSSQSLNTFSRSFKKCWHNWLRWNLILRLSSTPGSCQNERGWMLLIWMHFFPEDSDVYNIYSTRDSCTWLCDFQDVYFCAFGFAPLLYHHISQGLFATEERCFQSPSITEHAEWSVLVVKGPYSLMENHYKIVGI